MFFVSIVIADGRIDKDVLEDSTAFFQVGSVPIVVAMKEIRSVLESSYALFKVLF
mgnify:CR=1 FL=1